MYVSIKYSIKQIHSIHLDILLRVTLAQCVNYKTPTAKHVVILRPPLAHRNFINHRIFDISKNFTLNYYYGRGAYYLQYCKHFLPHT